MPGATAVVLSLTACAPSGLNFFIDRRVSIQHPHELQQVRLPYDVTWEARHLRPSQAYAVFVDRAPMPAGKDLRWLARDDQPCLNHPSCPDLSYLKARFVFVTRATDVWVTQLPDLRRHVGHGLDRHKVTIVLLDEQGRRVGESAWSREFAVLRPREGV